jgi:hypothetical protein
VQPQGGRVAPSLERLGRRRDDPAERPRQLRAGCGWTLARAHARSGDRIASAAYLGKSDRFDQAIAEFAAAYADRNERDHRALVQSIADGKIAAVAGV